jgi:hypothetical protein
VFWDSQAQQNAMVDELEIDLDDIEEAIQQIPVGSAPGLET